MIEYEFITEFSRLKHVAQEIEKAKLIGLDLETTDFSPRYGKIRLVQFIVPGERNGGIGNIYVLDLFELGGLGPVLDAMSTTQAIWVVHNAKFEQKWLWWYYRLRLWPLFDTLRSSVLIYNGKRGIKYDLDTVIVRELGEHPRATGQGGSDWSGKLTQLQKDYAAEDVYRLLRLRETLKQKLVAYGLLKAALVEFGVVFAEGRVELNGFAIDIDKWKTLATTNVRERTRLRDYLLAELPNPTGQLSLPGMSGGWNLDSSAQVLRSLQRAGLKIDGTKEIVLAQHAAKRPILKKLMDYRHVAQLVKTFGDKFLRHVESDGRIHPEYYGALVTGRYSANKSMQQIPRDPRFRSCFAPPPGRRLVGADYSGIEMRLCAEISGDEALTMVFIRDEDAHRATAAVIMEVTQDQVTKADRQAAKSMNFGLIYGMMPTMLVLYAMSNYGVSLTKKQATLYRERYFERYKGIGYWHARTLREGQRNGFARTLSGRIRYLDPNENHNEFFNTPVQGSGADALKTSLAMVQDAIDKHFGVTSPQEPDGPVRPVHHVHDEIILESDDDYEMVTEAETLLHDNMKAGMEKFVHKVPVKVDPSNGASWAEIH